MVTKPAAVSARALKIGNAVARRVFEKRGNKSEAHLSEIELAAFLALAAELALTTKEQDAGGAR